MSGAFVPSWMTFTPLSGPVTQMFAPLFNQQVDLTYAGSAAIEREVVAEVASFGTQIGVLTEAVLLLAGQSDAAPIEELRKIRTEVEAVKKRRRGNAEAEARKARWTPSTRRRAHGCCAATAGDAVDGASPRRPGCPKAASVPRPGAPRAPTAPFGRSPGREAGGGGRRTTLPECGRARVSLP